MGISSWLGKGGIREFERTIFEGLTCKISEKRDLLGRLLQKYFSCSRCPSITSIFVYLMSNEIELCNLSQSNRTYSIKKYIVKICFDVQRQMLAPSDAFRNRALPGWQRWMVVPSDAARNRTLPGWQQWMLAPSDASRNRYQVGSDGFSPHRVLLGTERYPSKCRCCWLCCCCVARSRGLTCL